MCSLQEHIERTIRAREEAAKVEADSATEENPDLNEF